MGEKANTDQLKERAIETLVSRLRSLNTELDKKEELYRARQTRNLEIEIFNLKDDIRELEDELYTFMPNK